jgi:pyruvate/2-oxoglutarate dehydrogenase complex dihydrolipoamide dehydrogenase (E3) component
VSLVQRASQLLTNEDPDASAEAERFLAYEGIGILTSAAILSVQGHSGDEVKISVRSPGGERKLVGSDVLVATGRSPNTTGIGLEATGVEVDAHGWLRGNDRFETTAPGIWAIGEVAGSPQFTHASLDDFRILRDNLAGGHRSRNDRLMPSCLFADPQVAHIGLTESQARQRKLRVHVAKLPMAAVLRTRTISELGFFMKALISKEDGRIVGFTMVGAEAGEEMGDVQMAMQGGLSYFPAQNS